MKSRNLLGLGALLLLAAVFFLSLMCPPARERETLPPESARWRDPPATGTSAAAPAEVRTPAPAEASDDSVLVRVTDTDGRPLLGAEVFLNWADKPGSAPAKRGMSNPDGTCLMEHLPGARYRVHAVADGFFPSATQPEFSIPARTRQEITLPLERGARIDGFVFGLDGAEVPNAWMRFRNLDDGTIVLKQADARGMFTSGPLRRGGWEVAWLEHVAAEPDPRILWTASIEAGMRSELIVTLDRVGAGREPRAGRVVGILPSGR